MAKRIKFNLICDGRPVRTIEDLQENFSIEDILRYYDNRLLHRWLYVRGFSEEFEAVSSICSSAQADIVMELAQIFDVKCNRREVEKRIQDIEYMEERGKLLEEYKQQNYETNRIIEDYAAGYKKYVDTIINNPDNAKMIKAAISQLVTKYAWAFKMNHRSLFYTLYEKSPLAIMCLLMNEQSRRFFLPQVVMLRCGDGAAITDADIDREKQAIFREIRSLINSADFEAKMGENLRTYSVCSYGVWNHVGSADKQYMIISIDHDDKIRSEASPGLMYDFDEIENEFIILDGFSYMSIDNTNKVRYMEV